MKNLYLSVVILAGFTLLTGCTTTAPANPSDFYNASYQVALARGNSEASARMLAANEEWVYKMGQWANSGNKTKTKPPVRVLTEAEQAQEKALLESNKAKMLEQQKREDKFSQ